MVSNRVVSRAERWSHGAVAVLLAAVFALSFSGIDRWRVFGGGHSDAGEAPPGGHPVTICALRNLTGFPCPTCGMTRSFCHIARGELAAAAGREDGHPLGPLVFLMFAVLLARSTVMAATGRACLDGAARLMIWAIVPLALAVLALWGVRLACMASDGTAAALWHASILGRLVGP